MHFDLNTRNRKRNRSYPINTRNCTRTRTGTDDTRLYPIHDSNIFLLNLC
ncbi:hypothetical protein HanXRQr2_Chr10g0428921 [Helianthus annuus]|uniref:Uncharacterized protein n=1 Tax=Helianthus annuus TaxID=4232 RepID=A0A9K3HVV4_HELAN|nr:hypothetical protein HanXRQr2_Chr10g0428921 [Helianthus annuus]